MFNIYTTPVEDGGTTYYRFHGKHSQASLAPVEGIDVEESMQSGGGQASAAEQTSAPSRVPPDRPFKCPTFSPVAFDNPNVSSYMQDWPINPISRALGILKSRQDFSTSNSDGLQFQTKPML